MLDEESFEVGNVTIVFCAWITGALPFFAKYTLCFDFQQEIRGEVLLVSYSFQDIGGVFGIG